MLMCLQSFVSYHAVVKRGKIDHLPHVRCGPLASSHFPELKLKASCCKNCSPDDPVFSYECTTAFLCSYWSQRPGNDVGNCYDFYFYCKGWEIFRKSKSSPKTGQMPKVNGGIVLGVTNKETQKVSIVSSVLTLKGATQALLYCGSLCKLL